MSAVLPAACVQVAHATARNLATLLVMVVACNTHVLDMQ